MDTLGAVVHKEFSYIHIPCDINSPVKVLRFQGTEDSFREEINKHFTRDSLLPEERQGFEKYLKEQLKDTQEKAGVDEKSKIDLTEDLLKTSIDAAGSTYQIIPLTLPTKKNGFIAINCYIDSIGRVKNLPTNARATKLCSTDIRGECFMSKTFDDEDIFKRVDMTMEEYGELFDNPPDPTGRWDSSQALSNMLNPQSASALTALSPAKEEPMKHCENCKKEETKQEPLKICSRCKKVKYCSVECQKEDWRFHKRICNAV